MDKVIQYILNELKKGRTDIEKIKKEASLKFGINAFIKNSELIKAGAHIIRKPVRTLSGVSPLAVMVKPEGSCKWNCIYCPYTGKAPKSYTGNEPAARRARALNFDPKRQVSVRLKHYRIQGHSTDKIELIIMGGTFLAMEKEYKYNFIKSIYDQLNNKNSKNLEEAKRINETSKHRVVGLTIETRPDVCTKTHIDEMLSYGATRVELGVQHPDDNIYRIIKRGHTVKHVVESTSLLKDSAFKIVYHIMLGLPGSNPNKDIKMIKSIFNDSRFRPDMLKIYPTLVMKNTELYRMYKNKEYTPYSFEQTVETILKIYKILPKYVRVMRIQRDIPSNLIEDGIKKSNLRQIVEHELISRHIKTNEIRFREIGLRNKKIESPKLFVEEYKASDGKEFFISLEDENRDYIIGFIRMRFPNNPFRFEISENTALIRELHVYGREVEIGKQGDVQHKGFGSKLLAYAEEMAKSKGMDKMVIISGVGARQFYYKHGYKLANYYVEKPL